MNGFLDEKDDKKMKPKIMQKRLLQLKELTSVIIKYIQPSTIPKFSVYEIYCFKLFVFEKIFLFWIIWKEKPSREIFAWSDCRKDVQMENELFQWFLHRMSAITNLSLRFKRTHVFRLCSCKKGVCVIVIFLHFLTNW